ncbi:MAG: hypothetical protein P1U56_17165 [Saprospiraceae bacterium]|nr:hypothetical protein [Saprospiraceae bacterium]
MRKTFFYPLICAILFFGCTEKPSIEGLWVVQSVKMGPEEMTPNGRWMRFNSDRTQTSGNGWFQHSIGTWDLDPKTQKLTVINTNGLDDANGPFVINLSNNEMSWSREEDGNQIEINLKRINQLPATNSEHLLGLWQLDQAIGNGDYFTPSNSSKDYLFFRWNKRFTINTENGRTNGVYNVHGHKPEVELIPYNDQLSRSFWTIQVKQESLTLQMLNTDSTVTRTFKRIHDFPK